MWNVTRPPVIAVILLVISIILHFIFPIAKIIFYPYKLSGILLIVVGLWIAIWGGLDFKKTDTPLTPYERKPRKLVVAGPFKFTRNPMYFGIFLFLFGIAIIFGTISAFISPIAFFIFINFGFIPYEEKMLEKIFGKKYVEYKKKVRKWI